MFAYKRLKRMVDAGWTTRINDMGSTQVFVTFTRGSDKAKFLLSNRVAQKILAYDEEN